MDKRTTGDALTELKAMRARAEQLKDEIAASANAVDRLLVEIAGRIDRSGKADATLRDSIARLDHTARQANASALAAAQQLAALKVPAARVAAAAVPQTAQPVVLDVASSIVFSERLTLIHGIDAAAAAILNGLGINQFRDIAALTPEDVTELGKALGDKRRIARQNWIEQAAILATGRDTAYAARVKAGDFAAVVPAPASAEVIDLAKRRREKPTSGLRVHDLARWAALAASITLVTALSVGGLDINTRLAKATKGASCISVFDAGNAACASLALLPE